MATTVRRDVEVLLRCALTLMLSSSSLIHAQAGDLRIIISKESTSTLVQQFNRDGVAAVKKHAMDKAKKLFYQAYLLDPDDPFTLNNLGYISELEGALDRAQRFYALALTRGQFYDAVIERSSRANLRGKTIAEITGPSAHEMQSNRANLEAMQLLEEDRVLEAHDVLMQALEADPNNPFTLNNLGLIKETEGDLQGALASYRAAAGLHSQEPVVVTTDREARGRPITELSERNARRIQRRLSEQDALETKILRLNFLGVYAINHNNLEAAHRYFQQAFELSPDDAFVLNNMGYLSEMDGDREAADSYYSNARTSEGATARVTAATRLDVIGMKLKDLAEDNDDKINAALAAELTAKRRRPGPIQLKRRDQTPVVDPPQPAPNH